jgi:hypothetical protein
MKAMRWVYLKKSIAGIMILVMGLMLVNNALYMHVHVLPNGKVCAHAHPFSKDAESVPGTAHHHSQADLNLFQALQLLFLLSYAALILRSTSLSGVLRPSSAEGRRSANLPPLPGRAPPFVRD